MATKFKNYVFTINNYTEDHIDQLEVLKGSKWVVYGKEKGEQGTPHLQGCLGFENQRSWNAVKKLVPGWHIEPMRGSVEQAIEYCKKDGDVTEIGTLPKQGERTDLKKIQMRIQEGEMLDDLVEDNPMLWHMYGRTLQKIEEIANRKKFRTEMTQGIWYWGPTGVGKSHKAFGEYNPEETYCHPLHDNGWWDNYRQQATVVINDFRGEIPYGELLNIVDKWPHCVKRRNRAPMPFTSKLVIITSSLPPNKVFNRRDGEDSIEQLLRRFEVRHLGGYEVVGGVILNPPQEQKDGIQEILEALRADHQG